MANKLRECITELHKNHTSEEVARAFSKYFLIMKSVAEAYTDNTTAWDLNAECPNLGFMHFKELEAVLEHVKAWRQKTGGQEPAQLESESAELEKRLAKMEELHRKRMEEARRRERTMITYMGMIAANRQDETAALLSALDDKALEAKYKDYQDSWGDE